jgi:hypothetical protein
MPKSRRSSVTRFRLYQREAAKDATRTLRTFVNFFALLGALSDLQFNREIRYTYAEADDRLR